MSFLFSDLKICPINSTTFNLPMPKGTTDYPKDVICETLFDSDCSMATNCGMYFANYFSQGYDNF